MEMNVVSADFKVDNFDNFIGQEKVIEEIKIYIKSAILRNTSLHHILLYGPPGLGKTTLAKIIAKEMNTNIKIVAGGNIKEIGDILCLLADIKENDIVFIDEIHRLPKEVEEILYSIMDEFYFTINIQNESKNSNIRIDLPKFTLIGATTLIGLLSNPFRSRFISIFRFDFYTEDDLKKIIANYFIFLGIQATYQVYKKLAQVSRGTPRTCINLIKRVYDYCICKNISSLTISKINEIFKIFGINEFGLSDIDIKILRILEVEYESKPVSLESIAVFLNENANNIKEVYEPYLIFCNLISRTKRGRIITKNGSELLKKINESF